MTRVIPFLLYFLMIALHEVMLREITAIFTAEINLAALLVLTVAVSFISPGGSYLYVLPLPFILGTAFLWFGNRPPETVPIMLFVFLALGAAALSLLWAPTLALLGVAMGSVDRCHCRQWCRFRCR